MASSGSGALAIAKVMARCGGSPTATMSITAAYRARATGSKADMARLIELAPEVPEPYRRTLLGRARQP